MYEKRVNNNANDEIPTLKTMGTRGTGAAEVKFMVVIAAVATAAQGVTRAALVNSVGTAVGGAVPATLGVIPS